MMNSKKIKGRIIELGMTMGEVAEKMGLSPYTFGKKISGKSKTYIVEAEKIAKILKISDNDFNEYFFKK